MSLIIDIGVRLEKRNPLQYISVHRSGDKYPTTTFFANGCSGIDVLFKGASSHENFLLEFLLMAGAPSCP